MNVFKPVFSVKLYTSGLEVMVCLYSSGEYKFCITWTPFQMGQICVTTLCCSACTCVCVVQAGLGRVCPAGN